MPKRNRRRHLLLVELLEERTLLNAGPVLTLPQTAFAVVKTSSLTVPVSATDRDRGDTLLFSLVGAPAGASITSTQQPCTSGSAASGTLSWTPTEDQGPASYCFTVVATDSDGTRLSDSKTITVNTLAVGLVGNNLWIVGTSINKGTATNPGNDSVVVSATNLQNTVSATINGCTGCFTVPAGGQIVAKLFAGNDSLTVNQGTGTQLIGPAISVDEGTGTNTLIINGTQGPDAFTITGTTVSLAGAGTVTYANVQTLLVNGLGGNDTFAMTGINASTATTLDGGAGTNSFSGTFSADFSGSLTLANMQSAALSVNGTVTAGSTITGTSFTNVALGTLAGALLAKGGSITGATISSIAALGLLEATETMTGSGGVLSQATIGNVAGSVLAGSIVNCSFGSVAAGGKVMAQGQGTTSNVSIGTLDGSFKAPEDSTSGSGVMSNTTIDSIGATGVVSTGSISGMSVGTTDSGSSITAAGQGTTSNVSIGTLDGSFMAPEDTASGSGVMSNTTIDRIGATGVVSTGSISGMSVGTTDSGSSITAAGQGTTSNVSIGTLDGSFMAPEDTTSGSGVMSNTTIDRIGATGVVSTGSISGMSVGTTDSGSSITAAGQGTTSNVSIGTLDGSFMAPEDSTSGSGVMTKTTIDSIGATGVVSTGSISGMSVGTTDSGSLITAAGQGTTSNVSIGTLDGSFMAPEDSTSGSGVMTKTTIDSIGATGVVSTGSISGMSVGTTDSGSSITAAGQGTTSNVSIGTLDGSFMAPEDSTAGSGVMSNTTIASIGITGVVSTGSISGMSVGTTDAGSSILAAGQGTTSNVSIGTLDGSFMAPEDSTSGSGVMSNTTIASIGATGVVSTGSISGMSVGTTDSGSSITAAGQGTIDHLTINEQAGTVSAKKDTTPGSGSLTNTTIGSLAVTGVINADMAAQLNITTDGGTVNITNTLTNFTAGTLLGTANLTAGHFQTVTAQHVGPIVHFIEPSVTRTVSVTPHVLGGGVPDFSLYYDGTGSGNPSVVVDINATTAGSFDLAVTTTTATGPGAGFDLAGVYSSGNNMTGIHNLVVAGNLLLGAVPAGAVSFLGLPANTKGGVELPQDIVAVAVAGNLPAASIMAKSVPALAANSFAGVAADSARNCDAQIPLAAGTGLSQAKDTFQLFFSEAGDVAQFLVTGNCNSFDSRKMLFSDIVTNNAPVTAQDTLIATGWFTSVDSVVFTGQGASLTTAQPIISMISDVGGSIGNLILSSPYGLANVTADRLIGNIEVTNGAIFGVVETTVGNLGSAFTDANGNITGVTTIHAGGGLFGKILAKGNLVSQVNLQWGLFGVVATDGDIGIIQTTGGAAKLKPDGSLIRFGGIVVAAGGACGEIIAQGNAFGDIKVTGGLNGRIAVQGNQGEFGLAAFRFGILGNVSICGGLGTTGAIVSSGLIGDDGADNINNDENGTHLTISGSERGIIAAGEDINFGEGFCRNQGDIFENATGSNLAAIDAIFTNNGGQLDVLDPAQLRLIVQDLLALKVSGGKLTGTTP